MIIILCVNGYLVLMNNHKQMKNKIKTFFASGFSFLRMKTLALYESLSYMTKRLGEFRKAGLAGKKDWRQSLIIRGLRMLLILVGKAMKWQTVVMVVLFIIIAIMVICLLQVIFLTGESYEGTYHGKIAWFLGVDNKKETIEFIVFGLIGMGAVFNAIPIHRRADEQSRRNELIEKRHVSERLKFATEHLGNESPIVRISAFYQFYYLAKEHKDTDFRKNVFDILCAHLRRMTTVESYKIGEVRFSPTEECKILLTILFNSRNKFIFGEFPANLSRVYINNAILTGANMVRASFPSAHLSYANFTNSNLSHSTFFHTNVENALFINTNLQMVNLGHTNFKNVRSIEGANFCGAMIYELASLEDRRPITKDYLPVNKGRYIADWTNDEFWAQVEKDEKNKV